MNNRPPTILFDSLSDDGFGQSWRFSGYLTTLSTDNPADVADLLATLESCVTNGLYAAGFIAYEAASGLNPHLPALPPVCGLPLVWFALFSERHAALSASEPVPDDQQQLELSPLLDQAGHNAAVAAIHQAIAAGESYQINYTFDLQGRFHGEPLRLYHQLLQAQKPPFGALIDTGHQTIISASPELFFAIRDGLITTRPMKGTAPRGRFPAEDDALADQLATSSKEQAENLMIVDLLRNDLGQIAETGSVQTEHLFTIEHYPTVHQMTSRIHAQLKPDTGLSAIFKALFPCGSVTGAPKRRSMELIAEQEGRARGVYCGAIGCLAPGGEATFSVAIRTLLIDQSTSNVSMGVGSGITWDAQPEAEYAECLSKAAFLNSPATADLLESILLDNGQYPLLERHLDRLCWSAGRLGYRCDRQKISTALLEHAARQPGQRKLRLLLAPDGSFRIESDALLPLNQPLRLAVATRPVDPADLSLYLKSCNRRRYDDARNEYPEADEVLLRNIHGELTEGSFTNLVLLLDNRLVTPPLGCGLLPGVKRAELLEQGKLIEQRLLPADLERAEEIWLINSVRGWLRAELIKGAEL